MPAGSRRSFLRGAAATAFTTMNPSALTQATGPRTPSASTGRPLTIQSAEVFELHGSYQEEAGLNRQAQVNPLDTYDQFRKPPYADRPSGMRTMKANAIYVRIRTSGGVDGLYGPDREGCGADSGGGVEAISDWQGWTGGRGGMGPNVSVEPAIA
jgi:L-rhamnonate dehydratase